jgi:3D (Asp-Asp-Asp) domain-containing protein
MTALLLAALLSPPPALAAPLRTARVTAYCSACNTPRHSDTGRYGRLKKGDIAADPRYWKAGTRIYIEGIGVCRVRDTGGAIKGRNRFDVYLGRKAHCPCNKWGAMHPERYQYRRVPTRAEVAK